MMASIQIGIGTTERTDGTKRALAEYRFARDAAEARFLDWCEMPEDIAMLLELTLGGVQADLSQVLSEKSQSLQYGGTATGNDSMWRIPA